MFISTMLLVQNPLEGSKASIVQDALPGSSLTGGG